MGNDRRPVGHSAKGTAATDAQEAEDLRWSRFIATHSVQCPTCEYELRGLDPHTRVCPECGGFFDPRQLMFAGRDISLGFVPGASMLMAMAATLGLHVVGHWVLPAHVPMQPVSEPPGGWSAASLVNLIVTVPSAVAAAPFILLLACSRYFSRRGGQHPDPFERGIEWLDARLARALWLCAGARLLIVLGSVVTLS